MYSARIYETYVDYYEDGVRAYSALKSDITDVYGESTYTFIMKYLTDYILPNSIK